jgi:hypothetical protein
MNYFKKMLSKRKQNSDGWAANYGVANIAGYSRTSKGYKELIARDKRQKKKWVNNHENKMIGKDYLDFIQDSQSDSIPDYKEAYFIKHYYPDNE